MYIEATYSNTPHANTIITLANPSPEHQRLCKVDYRDRKRQRERDRMKDQHAHSRDTQTSTTKRLKKGTQFVLSKATYLVKGDFTILARWVAYEFEQNHCYSYSLVKNPKYSTAN
jgi:hypothetical protein